MYLVYIPISCYADALSFAVAWSVTFQRTAARCSRSYAVLDPSLTAGTPFGPQCEDLRNGVHVLVCTPGRLLDHVRRQSAASQLHLPDVDHLE